MHLHIVIKSHERLRYH